MRIFPLDKCSVYITNDSDSFKNRDFNKETEVPIEPHCGSFGAKRKFDMHTGVDLYCNEGDTVFAIEDGLVVLVEEFTGKNANSEWWNDTKAVHIEGISGVIVYGEIEPNIEIIEGLTISAGQKIGMVKQVLKHDKGRPTCMLHVELYKHGNRQSCIWTPDKTKNKNMLNPTEMLIDLI